MTQAKVLQSSLQKSKKRLLAFLLSGTILAAGSGKIHGEPLPADISFDEAVKDRITLSGGKYTRAQAELRVLGARSGKFDYPGRSDKNIMKDTFEGCAQTDYASDQVPENSKALWENMQLLKNSKTIVGPALAKFSAQADIFYCSMPDIPSDIGGIFSKPLGLVGMPAQKTSPVEFLLTQIHETIHAIQKSNGVMRMDMSQPLKDYQTMVLSYEAAASAAEFVAGLDIVRTLTRDTLPPYMDFIAKNLPSINVYKDARGKGISHPEALTEAAAVKFQNQFKDQYWLDCYNSDVLEAYAEEMIAGNLTPPSGKSYSLDNAKLTGYISPEFNFLAKLDRLPSDEERFGNNISMRQAFDYVENERLAYTLGGKNPSYLEGLKKLKEEKNPYIGIDLKEVVENPTNHTFLQRMNYFAGMKKHAAHSPKTKGPHS